jgi:hypothetical protein
MNSPKIFFNLKKSIQPKLDNVKIFSMLITAVTVVLIPISAKNPEQHQKQIDEIKI